MDPFWQVVIGTAIGGALLNIYWLFKHYVQQSKASNESQTMAIWAIVAGLMGIITFGITSIVGLILAVISMRGKKFKALSITGLVISVLTMAPWIAVIIFGA